MTDQTLFPLIYSFYLFSKSIITQCSLLCCAIRHVSPCSVSFPYQCNVYYTNSFWRGFSYRKPTSTHSFSVGIPLDILLVRSVLFIVGVSGIVPLLQSHKYKVFNCLLFIPISPYLSSFQRV